MLKLKGSKEEKMHISLVLTTLTSVLGSLVLIYFWLRHLRTDLISHIDEITRRLDEHIEDEKQERTRKQNLLVQLNKRMDQLYQHILKKLSQLP